MVPDDGNFRRLEVIANRPGLTKARSGYYRRRRQSAGHKGATANGTASPLGRHCWTHADRDLPFR
jgi:hypothetical protein